LVALALLALAPAGFSLQVTANRELTGVGIDPTSAASGLTLLLGALAVMRGRTKRATAA
jgi:hypothetical protein